MIKKMVLIFAILMAAPHAAFALTIKPGDYVGTDNRSNVCRLFVREDGAIGLYYSGAYDGGLLFHPESTELRGNILKVSGSAEFSAAKAKITLKDDGTPVQASMGVGALLQLSYDIRCFDLVARQ